MVDFQLSDEQLALQQLAQDFAEKEAKPLAETLDKNHKPEDCISLDLLRRCSELGFRTLAIPERFGGGGMEDLLTVAIVCEELAVADVILPTIPANGRKIFAILNNPEVANEETRDKWLKAFCEDPTFMVAMAVTEPDAGGDNAFPYNAPGSGVRTSAVRDGDHYVLNGMKQFIAQGGSAKLYFVFTRSDPTKGILEGCSCFLVPFGHPGMTFGRVHDKMGSRLLRNQEIFFDNCRVPVEWRLGEEGLGLVAFRGSLGTDGVLGGARAIGVARRALEEIIEFCKNRVQGGKPVIEHQAIASEIADMYTTLQAMRSLVWNVAWSVDHLPRGPKRVPTVMTFCTKNGFDIAHRAAELAGGMGVMRNAPFEKLLRDAFSLKHLDGGNYIKRLKIGAAL